MNTQDATGLHLRQLFNLLRRRWKLITAAGVIAIGLAGTIGLVLPARYTAIAQIIIDPPRGSSGRGQPSAVGVLDEAAVQTQVAALISNNHLQRVLDSLVAEQGGESTAQQDAVGQLSMERLKRDINAYKELHSRVIGITYTSSSPALAAAVANRTVELYLAALIERNRADRNATLKSLNERIPPVRAEVARADAALQNYRIKYGFTDANRTDMVDQQLVELNRQLAVAKSDLAERDARIATLRELQRSENGTSLPINVLSDPILGELYREEAALRSRAEDATLPSERDAKVTSASSHLQKLRLRIGQTVDQTLSRLSEEKGTLEIRVRQLQRSIAILQDASTEAREPELRLRELQREATAFAQLYESLLQRQKETIGETDIQPDVRVLSFASIPDRPSSPNPVLFILPAMVFASIGAGLLAILLEQLDDTLRTDRDVTDALGIPCIGAIPHLSCSRKVRPHQLLSKNVQYAEAIRSVAATALQLTNPQKSPKVFLVTSSVPGEGKTTLAISLAVYAALLQRRVLLVDLAFRHPSIASELEHPADRGVSPALQPQSPAELIKVAPNLGIDYLPLSRDSMDPALLASERVPELLRQFKESYDCVVIDSAPLLSATESRLLASTVDQVLFAVKWGTTRREVAENALRLLRRSAFGENDLRDVTAVVLTQVNLKRHARYRYGDACESLLHVKPCPV